MASNRLSIDVQNISKTFKLETHEHKALVNVSFKIEHGERIGLIGQNGVGKTTLLNILCGFLQEDSGSKKVIGNINALMSLGAGLKEELTGRQNIYIDGELHNISHTEVDKYIEEIIAFADIGEYIDKPVKIYSSGMKARLMFSMVTKIEPEILIIDEVLGVGDAEFSLKAKQRIEQLCSKGKILIVVSHSMNTIRDMTNRTIWLDNGQIKHDGASNQITKLYQEYIHEKEEKSLLEQFTLRQEIYKYESDIIIKDFYLESDRKKQTIFYTDDNMNIVICLVSKTIIDNWDIKISLLKMDGTLLLENTYSKDMLLTLPMLIAGEEKKLKIDFGTIKFSEGTLEVLCEITGNNGMKLATGFVVMQIINDKYKYFSKPEYFCSYSIETEGA